MSIDMMGEVDRVTNQQISELKREEQEAALIPEGKYEGTLISWVKQEESEKGENNPLRGVSSYRVGFVFYDCPDVGKKKSGFFSMTNVRVLNKNNNPRTAYTSLVKLVEAMGMSDVPIPDVLEQARVKRANYDIGVFTAEDGKKRNFIKTVSAV